MIVLAQRQTISGDYEDIRIPLPPGPPRRKRGINVDEMADLLMKAKAVGIYRVVTDNGDLFRITVERSDSYQVKVEPTTPDIV